MRHKPCAYTVDEIATMKSPPYSLPKDPTPAEFDAGRLRQALTDSRSHPIAYPILARHGYMEKTANGYKAIDPEAVISRCRELLAKLEAVTP